MCVSAAAQVAGKPSTAWLAAEVLADDNDLDVAIVVRFVSAGHATDDEDVDLNTPQREKLERISVQLKAMVVASVEFQRYLDQRLAAAKEKG